LNGTLKFLLRLYILASLARSGDRALNQTCRVCCDLRQAIACCDRIFQKICFI
jgi:hypothetical protein